jgi:phage-related protein
VLRVLEKCRKELEEFPEDVNGDLADAVALLEQGQVLSMQLSRPMPTIGSGVHEPRLRDRAGIYGWSTCWREQGWWLCFMSS